MLFDRARKSYDDNLWEHNLSFKESTAYERRRFITAEHERTLSRQWKYIVLKSLMTENTGKPPKFCLEELVVCMYTLHCGISNAYRNDSFFKNKWRNYVKDLEERKLAYLGPARIVQERMFYFHEYFAELKRSDGSTRLDALLADYKSKDSVNGTRTQRASIWFTMHCSSQKKLLDYWATKRGKPGSTP